MDLSRRLTRRHHYGYRLASTESRSEDSRRFLEKFKECACSNACRKRSKYHFSLSSGAGLLALLANRPPKPPRSLRKNFPMFFRFSFNFAPVSAAPAPLVLKLPTGPLSLGGLCAPSRGVPEPPRCGLEKRSMIALPNPDGSNFMLAGKLAVLNEAAAELPSADRFCSAADGAAAGWVPEVTLSGVRRGDFSTSDDLYRSLSLCI